MNTRNTTRYPAPPRNPAAPRSSAAPDWLKDFLQQQEAARERAHQQQLELLQSAREEAHQQQLELIQSLLSSQNNQQNSGASNNNHYRNEKIASAPRPPLLQADANYSKFLSWRETWQDYAMLIKLDSLEEETQRAHLRSCISEEMRNYIKCALGISKETSLSCNQILDDVEHHLRQRRNIALDRVAFEERRQQEGESFDNFFVNIKKLSAEADLCGHCLDQRLVTKIMTGVRCKDLKQKLLAISPFPELKEVINICRSYESSVRDSTSLDEKTLNKISKYKLQKKSNPTDPVKTNSNNSCIRCGYNRHPLDKCPARDATCGYCKKVGHWTKNCLLAKKQAKQNIKLIQQNDD